MITAQKGGLKNSHMLLSHDVLVRAVMNISVKINITIALLLGQDPFVTPVTDETGQRVREA